MRINKKLKSLIGLCVIIILLLGAGLVLKNIFLHQIKKKIQSSFGYAHLHLSFFPPALILEEVKTRSLSPFFSAKKIVVQISYKSLLSKEKPFYVFIEHPILRIYSSSAKKDEREKTKFGFSLPFAIEKGLIKEGELYFWRNEDRFQAKGLNALFVQKKDRFLLKAEAEENLIYLASAGEQIEGKVSISLEGQGKEIDIKRIIFVGPDGILKAEGSLVDPFDPEFQLKTSLKVQTPLLAKLLKLPFEWEGKAEGKGRLIRNEGIIGFSGGFSSERLVLNGVLMGRIRGRVDFVDGSGGTVEFNIRKKSLPQEFVRIHFKKDKVWGITRSFFLDPIINFVSLPWPIFSPVWGNFAIEKGNLTVNVEFRDESIKKELDRFPLSGFVKFNRDRNDEISFSSEALTSSFAHVNIEGKLKKGQRIDIRIQGEVRDLKQARHFTSLILAKKFDFPEIRGKGQTELRIFGDYQNPQVESSFVISPGGFDKFDAHSIEGGAKIINGEFLGRFNVDDPFFKGKINLFSNQEGLKAGIQLERGTVERIFPALDIGFPLEGEASGNFDIKQGKDGIQLKGNFSSSLIIFENQKLKDVSGEISWNQDGLSLSNLQFDLYQARIKGNLFTQFSTQQFDIDILGDEIGLSSFYSGLKGSLSFKLKGRGIFGQDLASGQFEIKDFELSPLKKTDIRGEARAGYSPEQLYLELKGNFFPGDNEVNASLNFHFKEESLSAKIKGTFRNLDLFLPWKGAKGSVNYLAEIKGPKISPQIKGVVDFNGSLLPLPRFAHAIHDYSGLIFIENSQILIRSLKAKLGGGDIQGFGEMRLGKGGVENINLKIEGKRLLLSPLERTRALVDGTLNLFKGPNRFLLDGEFSIQRLSWRRDLDEKIVFYSSPYYTDRREPGFFDDLTLNIRLKADDNAWIENSLGRAKGRFDLTIIGNVNAPIILGDIEVLEGNVYYQDRKFKILRGSVSFFNPSAIEPYLNFKGETYIRNYRVTFALTGFIDHLNPEFSSSPPLPPEDVLALLAMGEAFKRTYSYDTSTRLSTASLLSFQLSEEAKKRAERLFSLDRFRIDPFVLGSSAEMTARLTIGKKISRNFFMLYSTNLTTQREEIARLEWELTDDFSIVGTRDEEGKFSIDVKIHKRF